MTAHYDVVVVGAGPAGLDAARTAARQGARVAVLDDNPRPGGQVWRQGPAHAPGALLGDVLAALKGHANVSLWPSTRVVAPLPERGLLIESGVEDGVTLHYDQLILATGARERFLPFAGWTLPGVTGAGALQALIKGGTPVRGERVVIAGSGPLLIAALASAREAGAHVVAVIEQASAAAVARFGVALVRTPSKLLQAAQLTRGFAGLRYWTNSVVKEAQGHGRVEAVVIRRGSKEETLGCERIACGYGLVPNVTLAQSLGCVLDATGAIAVDDAQRTSVDGVLAAGECTGIGGMELARIEGRIAGFTSAGVATQEAVSLLAQRDRWRRFARCVEDAFTLTDRARVPPSGDTLLCRCEDVTVGEVRAHASWRDAKLHTRCGMGACQGRICGAAAQTFFGWDAAQSQPRPPFSPARIATLIAASDDRHDSESAR
ncbi:FAD-dependent oxidoreductase [Paraburkholderia gardini]|uniref:Hydrogen cyanide synthase subunit HcnB n=1 Tax=Paraburkholderia gardini TaxID=2823469 RepID=A0ABN7QMR9_9BURK|nr:FAD-dependent oxidoreductase [Paraburkholderia gardini]CAG4902793.1 Hydrogen cyanide synthase subunit HcnB [Paraburkholderia gardini]CAG4910367.1 Hydrogen cyanide synthase subunit HcnB [Paraburkholderia gardini]